MHLGFASIFFFLKQLPILKLYSHLNFRYGFSSRSKIMLLFNILSLFLFSFRIDISFLSSFILLQLCNQLFFTNPTDGFPSPTLSSCFPLCVAPTDSILGNSSTYFIWAKTSPAWLCATFAFEIVLLFTRDPNPVILREAVQETSSVIFSPLWDSKLV